MCGKGNIHTGSSSGTRIKGGGGCARNLLGRLDRPRDLAPRGAGERGPPRAAACVLGRGAAGARGDRVRELLHHGHGRGALPARDDDDDAAAGGGARGVGELRGHRALRAAEGGGDVRVDAAQLRVGRRHGEREPDGEAKQADEAGNTVQRTESGKKIVL